jgi:hypothetical protein
MTKWMLELANLYDISLETVMGVYNSFADRVWRYGRHIGKRERTEQFFKLYFEGVKEE